MATKITSASAIQNEPKRPIMIYKLLEAAIDGNEADLRQLLGLNDEGDHPPHTKVSVEDVTPMEPSMCLRSATGMKNTILHILSANGHGNLVSTICMKDSSLLKARNVRNETPFHQAARFGHINTISELIRCAKSAFGEAGLKELLRQPNCLGETALHEAARRGHGAVVSTLMEEDLELAGLVNDDSVSPLYLATARGSLDMVKNMVAKILKHKITPPDFYSGPEKQTALHAAVLQDTGLTKELLKLYSEPVDKWADETGRNPFHLVASTGNYEIAKLLLDKDPSMAYIQDSDGSFPVHTAVRMGHAKMIVLLLQRYLDSGDLLDSNGRNFLHVAIEGKKSNVIFRLLKDSKKELPISYWNKMLNTMANTMDNKGDTPLHLAAKHEYNYTMLSLLKNNELDLTLQNKKSLTAFDLSVIQFRKSASDTERRDYFGEYYVKKRGAHFSIGWFQHYTKDQMSETESETKLETESETESETELIRGTNEDHISTMDARGAKMNSPESLMAKAQLVGLGSVLIATVSFAAAFTLPGGTNQETGIPILAKKKYIFQAFILADYFAFFYSFLATMVLIYSSRVHNSDMMEKYIYISMKCFTLAAQCMVISLGLGLYLVLAPIGKIGVVVLVWSLFLVLSSNILIVILPYWSFRVQSKILKHIPDVASDVNSKDIRAVTVLHPYIIFIMSAIYTISPLMYVFVLALLFSLENYVKK